MALHDHFYALTCVTLLLPFLLIVGNRRRSNKLNLPCAGSGFRTPSFLLPIVSLFWGRDLIEDIYNKQKNIDEPQPYVLPGILGNEVVLPKSWIPWLASRPESILSGKWSRLQRMNFETTFLRAEVVTNPIQETVIRRDLMANLDKLAPELADEIAVAVDELWGCNVENYKTVSLQETIFRIVARASSRVFAGKVVCRDANFIDNSIRFTMAVITSGFVMKVIPKAIEPLLVWILVSYVRFHYSKLSRVLEPLFQSTSTPKQPCVDFKENGSRDGNSEGETAVQWLAVNATRDPNIDPKEQTPPWLALRLMTLLFAAVDTTSLTSINALLDVFTERAGGSCVPTLREEARRNIQLFGGRWDRARLNNMPRHDSMLRESMRLSGFAIKILQRKVMASEGIVLPNGTVLPQGTMVCVSAWGLHHDEQVYPNPSEFSPERFMLGYSSSSEERESKLRNSSDRKGVLLRTATEADPSFTFWGLGKQSCPGRYLAVDLIKILMEYVVMNYDVVPLKQRPENMWIEYNYVPSANAKLQVRRRRT
ncbi:cytochrome P450 [Delitschia confertaspora ATCC 74209]|uniref:Cytochrome P450 n=1 Tax=Delitschia confertaspora ATCC 74209 TaxID=1513339 RepID=A0A9P4MWK7_9PLEO|nr:cytochrome P450 [Delitschia confertaspora ATCC 74209]